MTYAVFWMTNYKEGGRNCFVDNDFELVCELLVFVLNDGPVGSVPILSQRLKMLYRRYEVTFSAI